MLFRSSELCPEERRRIDAITREYLQEIGKVKKGCVERFGGIEIGIICAGIIGMLYLLFVIIREKIRENYALITLAILLPMCIGLVFTLICCNLSTRARTNRRKTTQSTLNEFSSRLNREYIDKNIVTAYSVEESTLIIKYVGVRPGLDKESRDAHRKAATVGGDTWLISENTAQPKVSNSPAPKQKQSGEASVPTPNQQLGESVTPTQAGSNYASGGPQPRGILSPGQPSPYPLPTSPGGAFSSPKPPLATVPSSHQGSPARKQRK